MSAPEPPVRPENDAERPPFWPYVLAFFALALLGLAFGEMARLARLEAPDGFDLHLSMWVSRHHQEWPGLTRLFGAMTWLGDAEVATPLTCAVALALLILGRLRIARLRKREALFWLGVAISGRVLCVLLKLWFERERPPESLRLIVIDDDSFSFPSGHSEFAAVFFTMLAILIARAVPASRGWLRVIAIGVCMLMALLVGASRVWLNVHYASDVAGGLLLGVAWVILAYLIRFGWWHWRWRRRLRNAARNGPTQPSTTLPGAA